jgi:general secretion pathway protein G
MDTNSRGFTIIEMLLAMGVIGILSAIAVPSYSNVMERQRQSRAEADLQKISVIVLSARDGHGMLPASIGGLAGIPPLDPWGRPYQYLRLDPLVDDHDKNRIRKDHNLHPINSDFDLYSYGPDGDSNAPLTAQASRDDIIYGRDGRGCRYRFLTALGLRPRAA